MTRALRTGVCLRDFCDHVLDEERDWLEERLRQRGQLDGIERCRRRTLDADEDGGMVFRDEDFVLPGSLKAREMEMARKSAESERLVQEGRGDVDRLGSM